MTWIRKPLTGHSAALTGKCGVHGPRTCTGNELPTIIIVNHAPRTAVVNGQEARYHIANGQEHQVHLSENGLKVLLLRAEGRKVPYIRANGQTAPCLSLNGHAPLVLTAEDWKRPNRNIANGHGHPSLLKNGQKLLNRQAGIGPNMSDMNRRGRNLLSQDRDYRRTEVGVNLRKYTWDNGQEVLKQEDSQTKLGFTQTDKEVQVTKLFIYHTCERQMCYCFILESLLLQSHASITKKKRDKNTLNYVGCKTKFFLVCTVL